LRADTVINCRSQSYLAFKASVIVFILVYLSVPVLWYALLVKNKSALDPPTSNNDEQLQLFIRDNDASLSTFKFLFKDYR
jgi:hypothetical protein